MLEAAERRNHRRFNLNLPLHVRLAKQSLEEDTSTVDISARGVHFSVSGGFEAGAEIECVVTLPPEICQGSKIRVRCLGRIVRVVGRGPEGRLSIAAAIEKYEILGGPAGRD